MFIEDSTVSPQERIGFLLRELYARHGYTRYRMSKFEEYDLYSRNKDYLFSEGVITFTDTNGRLMALKPDVTLSIVKNGRDTPGEVRKLYYHENVYRVSVAEDGFREQTQVGVECMGAVNQPCIAEMLELATESLKLCSPRYVLEVSHLDLLSAVTEAITDDERVRKALLHCVGEKNSHGIRGICRENGIAGAEEDRLIRLLSLYGTPAEVLPGVTELAREAGAERYAEELRQAVAALDGGEDRILIDFSATGNTKYYNGIAFKGFIDGIPGSVLSGGQYDHLMRRMGRKDRAVGFAVFLDALERLKEEGEHA